MKAKIYDDKAVGLANVIKLNEGRLLTHLMEMKRDDVLNALKYKGIYQYCVKRLDFDESQAYYYKAVADKSEIVSELKAAIVRAELTISRARRICPVITPENATEWISKAKSLPQKEVERQVRAVNPRARVTASIKPVSKGRSELQVEISHDLEDRLRLVTDLLAQKLGRHVTLEEAIEAMTECYLDRYDPVRKATRAASSSRKKTAPSISKPGRHKTSAQVAHQVNLRDERRCTGRNPDGSRCEERRWLDIHHIIHVQKGGPNTAENLTTLCKFHHRLLHQ